MTQRRTEIRSRKYLDGSRGQPCTLQITGVCTGDVETTVAAHIRDETFGMAQKADDTSVVDACGACHDAFDGRTHAPLTREEWLEYALRGMQRTIRNRVLRGIVVLALDPERLSSERPIKPRKPPAERKPIRSRNEWPAGRKIPSRPLRTKEAQKP
jgi:hypothetical protein